MTPEEKRIAIAEACPSVACKNINGEWLWKEQQSRFFDPLSDLNAMHEAEKVLTDTQLQRYGEHLQKTVNYYCVGVVGDYHRDLKSLAKIAGATAAQRADAFLLTLGILKP